MTIRMTDQQQEVFNEALAAFDAVRKGARPEDHSKIFDGLRQFLDSSNLPASSQGEKLLSVSNNAALNARDMFPNDLSKEAQETFGAKNFMPIPHVTKKGPNGNIMGLDLFSYLIEGRTLFLNGGVDDTMAAIACAALVYLDQENSEEPITLYINSPGGSVIDGNAIIDTMEFIAADTIGVGIGMQASMGSHILAACTYRYMMPKALLLIHSISSGTQGTAADQAISLDRTERLFEEGKANYIRHIGLTGEYWDLCSVRDSAFSAEQAKDAGFIHGIIESKKKSPAPYEKSARQYLFDQAARREAQLPKTERELVHLLQSTSAQGSLGERGRPEILVALAKMPKYWVIEKQEEFAKENNIDLGKTRTQAGIARILDKWIAGQKAANDNTKTSNIKRAPKTAAEPA